MTASFENSRRLVKSRQRIIRDGIYFASDGVIHAIREIRGSKIFTSFAPKNMDLKIFRNFGSEIPQNSNGEAAPNCSSSIVDRWCEVKGAAVSGRGPARNPQVIAASCREAEGNAVVAKDYPAY